MMGYTHYWRTAGDNCPAEAWEKIINDASRLIEASPARLTFEEEDDAPPQIDSECIRFNGFADGCETFVLNARGRDFDFCKTRERPYDMAVCAILAVAAQHAPSWIKVSSDGDDREWRKPLAWASGVLGRPVPLPPNVTHSEE